ncbi:outer membrane receptor protein involved in Fe transport [Tahibacter aquaticus]|uniref:Outer membrane receptor protein involved in Fe transport n=1 Tax=Tahibacter aquaticus TaxID=520092 RepID=A0A4R6Z9N5_9GAMM|nr:TonB-dependent receptor [Tahibacter aquaticus]TDR48638.1 outer membrane receptor protein involved in Fe transport [Tahibacter aquaticus]
MKRPRPGRGYGMGIALSALWALLPAATTKADATTATTLTVRIEAGPLDQALTAFARQSGLQILFDSNVLANRHSTAISAQLEPEEALRRLLAGSGFYAEAVAPSTYVLKREAAPPKTATATTKALPEEDTDASHLPPVQVLGSLMRRGNWQTAAPISVITREQIDRSGMRSLFDLLRVQPSIDVTSRAELMASQPIVNYLYGGAAGAATLGMRGLGARATLILLDGRRIAGYGLTQSGSGLVVDVNDIPLDLVERIEILRDGASAMYGADAIGGVINIVLRQSFDGRQLALNYGVSGRGDTRRVGTAATLGGQVGAASVFLHAQSFQRDPLLGNQRDWYTRDLSHKGLYDLRTLYSFPGNYAYLDEKGQVQIRPMPGCTELADDGLCLLDEAKYTTLQTRQKGNSLLARLTRPAGDTAELYADLRLSRLDQAQQAAPIGFGFNLPAGFPGNPAPGPAMLFYSFNDVGPVRENTRSRTHALNLGMRGRDDRYEWNLAFSVQGNSVDDRIDGFLNTSDLLRRINDGSYRLGGPNPAATIAAISPPLHRQGRTRQFALAADGSGQLAQWPSGPLQLSLGLELRHLAVLDVPDPLLRSDDRPFGERSYVQRTSNNVLASYAELQLPLSQRFSAELGMRLDHSAATGSAFSPKLGLRWRASDVWLLHATAARGHRPPSELELQQPMQLSELRPLNVPQALLPCSQPSPTNDSNCTLEIISRNNLSLRAENSRSFALGTTIAGGERWRLSLDWIQIARDNEITPLPITYALQNPEQFPNLLRYDDKGQLSGLNVGLVNLGRTHTRSLDGSLQWSVWDGAAGSLSAHVDVTYLERRDVRVAPGASTTAFAGYDSSPRLRGRAGLDWTRAAWTASANANYVGSYRNATFAGDTESCVDLQSRPRYCTTPQFATVDLVLGYASPRRWNARLSIINALDHKPVYYGANAANYNDAFDDPVGRYFSVDLSYRF